MTGRRLAAVPDAPEVLRVTVVGADAGDRGRLVVLLAGTPGIEVVGWTARPLPRGGVGSEAPLSVVVETGNGMPWISAASAPEPPLASPQATPVAAPRLSPRQREVLTAYSSSNDLLPVVARRLCMAPETVKTHLRRIRCKYEEAGRPAPTRRDLYVRAAEDGLLVAPL